MENELRSHLLTCARAFAEARDLGLVTVGRLAANDWSFFERIADPSKAFTARTYDKVMEWFSANWPEGTEWPAGVPRPGAPQSPFLVPLAGGEPPAGSVKPLGAGA